MKNERNWLLRDALPQLQNFALEIGVQLQLVDLRWGVTEEMIRDPRVGPVRLEQIRLCRQHSCGPNFVVSDINIVRWRLLHCWPMSVTPAFLRQRIGSQDDYCQRSAHKQQQQDNRRLHFARAVHCCHPFPPIGDAAYRQRAGGGPSRGHRQHAQRIW